MQNKVARLKKDNIAYVFLLPSFIGVLFFSMGPLVVSIFLSLTDWNFTMGFGNWNFVGLSNFAELLKDQWFTSSIKNTIIISIVTVPVGLALAMVIAVLIDNFCHKKIASVLRIAMYMPHICNIVASSAVWKALYSSYGPFTQMVRTLGWTDPPRWLANYTWALPSLMLVMVWASLGYRVFIYSAAMASMPTDVYESARIDGANTVQQFFHITIPLLRPTTFFLTITGIISSFKVFGYTNVMTQGGPGSSTYTLVYYIYTAAFKYQKFGYASAIAVVLFLMLLVLTLVQWANNNKNEM